MASLRPITTINLGVGEVPGVVNQQRPAAVAAGLASSLTGQPVEQLAQLGDDYLICPNTRLPLADDSVVEVITNSVPVDIVVLGEPGVQSGAIVRILASGGRWVHDGALRYTKP